eukprot:CAMPEP_0179244824 /NCGR_PEP_ID=MMETSP0797-20121207/18254_1 /TAXON_ID=47934 /ORGANISM="Dinophysis acuminata, Strain DAEP01" /LENGTH=377 /DNA_ID=CAMNT_0020952347 /DNA_START=22 /DNA_END=1151 /DNA_ORIENTATION=-
MTIALNSLVSVGGGLACDPGGSGTRARPAATAAQAGAAADRRPPPLLLPLLDARCVGAPHTVPVVIAEESDVADLVGPAPGLLLPDVPRRPLLAPGDAGGHEQGGQQRGADPQDLLPPPHVDDAAADHAGECAPHAAAGVDRVADRRAERVQGGEARHRHDAHQGQDLEEELEHPLRLHVPVQEKVGHVDPEHRVAPARHADDPRVDIEDEVATRTPEDAGVEHREGMEASLETLLWHGHQEDEQVRDEVEGAAVVELVGEPTPDLVAAVHAVQADVEAGVLGEVPLLAQQPQGGHERDLEQDEVRPGDPHQLHREGRRVVDEALRRDLGGRPRHAGVLRRRPRVLGRRDADGDLRAPLRGPRRGGRRTCPVAVAAA